MNITCPNCQTRYKINPQALGQGRTVRCTACGHRWLVVPPTAEPPVTELPPAVEPQAEPPPAESPPAEQPAVEPQATEPPPAIPEAPPLPTPAPSHVRTFEPLPRLARAIGAAPLPPRMDRQHQAKPRSTGRVIVFCLALLLVALAVTGFIVGRNELAALFPGLVPAYDRLDLPLATAPGLEFRGLRAVEAESEGRRVLALDVEIHNVADVEHSLPKIDVILFDKARKELERTRLDPPQASLPPGGMTRLKAEVPLPASGTASYKVDFAGPG